MLDELLPYYNDELAFIKRLVLEYAGDHGKIAGRLKVGQDGSEDPHVSRLIEAFALLNARIRYKLDDDFPELTDSLLGALYPHYQAPIPSMAIVRFCAAEDLSAPYELDRASMLESERVDGEPCRFRTCYDLTLWPIAPTAASYTPSTAGAPLVPQSADATAVLQLELSGQSAEAAVDQLCPDSLTFYLRADAQTTQALYEALFNDAVHIAVASGVDDQAPIALPMSSIAPVGFDIKEGLLPYPKQAFLGYRLLTEHFVFPEKFSFVRFNGLAEALREKGRTPRICVYFRRARNALQTEVDEGTFVLGCTPVVNLFERDAEPIAIEHAVTRYAVVPDARRKKFAEVYSVDKVSTTDVNGSHLRFVPFYGADHWNAGQEIRNYYTTTRRAGATDNPGTEMDISFVDLDFNPLAPPTRTARIGITCVNRDLPSRLPFGDGQPRLKLDAASPAIDKVECLTAPTRTLRPPLRGAALWRLVSHLNLNHLSLADGEQGARALREILALYDFRQSPETKARIDSIVSIRSRSGSARVLFEEQHDANRPAVRRSVMARGVDVEVEFDEQRFPTGGAYLFGSILEHFFGHYCTLNAFTRVTAKLRNQEGVFARWPARNGDRVLV